MSEGNQKRGVEKGRFEWFRGHGVDSQDKEKS